MPNTIRHTTDTMRSEIGCKIGLTLVSLPAIVMAQLHDKPRVMVLTLLNRPTMITLVSTLSDTDKR